MATTQIKSRIRKLLLTAADSRTPENERKNARAIADKMMRKHGISEAQIWSETKVDDIPEDMQDDFLSFINQKGEELVSALEKKQDEVLEQMISEAEKYAKKNKETVKKKFSDWIDGFFKD